MLEVEGTPDDFEEEKEKLELWLGLVELKLGMNDDDDEARVKVLVTLLDVEDWLEIFDTDNDVWIDCEIDVDGFFDDCKLEEVVDDTEDDDTPVDDEMEPVVVWETLDEWLADEVLNSEEDLVEDFAEDEDESELAFVDVVPVDRVLLV